MARDGDEESVLSLQQVDPSPVEETPSNFKSDGDYFGNSGSDESPPPRSHQLGLSQHSTLWYLNRVQKYSSYVFSAFAVAHITNTSIIPLVTQSVPASEPYILLTRPYYQSWPIAEPFLIIIPLAAHIGSGLALRIYRRNLNAQRYGAETRADKKRFGAQYWPKVSGISKLGFAATWLVLGHTFINRAIPAKFPGGSSNINLSYVSHAFAKHPAISYAGFVALIAITVSHTTWGWAKWLGFTPDQVTDTGAERQIWRKRRWYVVNGVAAAVAGLWMAGGIGVVGRGGEVPGWVGKEYNDMYRSVPVIGQWM